MTETSSRVCGNCTSFTSCKGVLEDDNPDLLRCTSFTLNSGVTKGGAAAAAAADALSDDMPTATTTTKPRTAPNRKSTPSVPSEPIEAPEDDGLPGVPDNDDDIGVPPAGDDDLPPAGDDDLPPADDLPPVDDDGFPSEDGYYDDGAEDEGTAGLPPTSPEGANTGDNSGADPDTSWDPASENLMARYYPPKAARLEQVATAMGLSFAGMKPRELHELIIAESAKPTEAKVSVAEVTSTIGSTVKDASTEGTPYPADDREQPFATEQAVNRATRVTEPAWGVSDTAQAYQRSLELREHTAAVKSLYGSTDDKLMSAMLNGVKSSLQLARKDLDDAITVIDAIVSGLHK